jgi:hypothetical protein
MKNVLLFFLVVFAFSSCSDNNEMETLAPTPLLEKVIFNASSTLPNQRHWNFNENGFLQDITSGDGTLLYTFTYDSSNRVIQATLLNTNGTPTNYNFTYNNDGSVASLNTVPILYDNALQAYYFGDLDANYRVFKLNTNGLLTYSKEGYVEIENGISFPYTSSEANAVYEENNLKGQSFHNGTFAGFEHDDNVNPLRNASLAVFKAMAVTTNNEAWLNSYAVSTNNVNRKNYASEYFIHEEYVYEFNSDNLPVSATLNFYSNNALDFSVIKTLYYYQGD